MDNSAKPTLYLVVVLVAVVVLGGAMIFLKSYPAAPKAVEVPGLKTGPLPWSTDPETLEARLNALNLPVLKEEGTTLHTHEHLDIFIDGKAVPIPADIGVDTKNGFISPVHTHDGSGVIHVESPVVQQFTLGQFFGVWGVRLSSYCLGGYCNDAEHTLSFYVDGNKVTDDPNTIALLPHEEIAIVFGTASDTPKIIPRDYAFGPDL